VQPCAASPRENYAFVIHQIISTLVIQPTAPKLLCRTVVTIAKNTKNARVKTANTIENNLSPLYYIACTCDFISSNWKSLSMREE
jgi:hypothetical protein